jgi:hypothetical protein
MEIKSPYRRKDVLAVASQEAIMERYTGVRLTYSKFLSPFRKESRPSCNFYYIGETLMYRDRGCYDHGDCFFVAKKVLGEDDLYGKIIKDFVSSPSSHSHWLDKRADKLPKRDKVGSLEIEPTIRPWDSSDQSYWYGRYGIERDTARYYGIESTSYAMFKSSDYEYSLIHTTLDPLYSYKMAKGIYKTYMPLTTGPNKWKNNYGSTSIQIVEGDIQRQGSPILIIQKALKENAYIYQHHKIDSVSSTSETSMINEVSMGKYLNYYEKVYVMLDNDATGLDANLRYRDRYGVEPILLPSGIKNITDFHQTNPNEAMLWLKERLTH